MRGLPNDLEDCVLCLASGLSIRDSDDENGLAKLARSSWAENERLQDLLVELCAHRREAGELDAADHFVDLLLRPDAVSLLRRIHKPNLHSVIVEEGSSEGDAVEDEFQVSNTLAILLKLHAATVIDVEYDVEEAELDDILTDFAVHTPFLAKYVNLLGGTLSDLVKLRCVWWIESLKTLFLNGR
jgi:hypothetical protein